jgi:hypothetical protein
MDGCPSTLFGVLHGADDQSSTPRTIGTASTVSSAPQGAGGKEGKDLTMSIFNLENAKWLIAS